MIGGRCPDQVDLAYIVSTYEENSANNHLFLKVHLISFDSMYNMCQFFAKRKKPTKNPEKTHQSKG